MTLITRKNHIILAFNIFLTFFLQKISKFCLDIVEMIPNESKLRKSNNLPHFLRRRNFSFFPLYLVANSLIACYSLQKLLVVKNHLVLHGNSLVVRYSLYNHLLLVVKFARYSLQKLLVAKDHSLVVAKFARCSMQKSLIAKTHSLVVAKFTRWSLHKGNYFLQTLLKNNSITSVYCKNCKNTDSAEHPYTPASKNNI